VEVPVESDGTVLLSSIQSQFPQAIGIKFRNPTTRAFRAVKLCDNILHPPSAVSGWDTQNTLYIVNVVGMNVAASTVVVNTEAEVIQAQNARKRESSETMALMTDNAKRVLSSLCSDLIVLNLPYTFDDNDLRRKFEDYGEMTLCEIKRESGGKSKGFGFIRFAKYEDQKKVQGQSFTIEGRRIEVKKPRSKESDLVNNISSRLFVGQLDSDITKEDLSDYFEQFGQINSIFYDQGAKTYAFVEFEDAEIAMAVLRGGSHEIKNKTISIRTADPRNKQNQYGGSSARYAIEGGGEGWLTPKSQLNAYPSPLNAPPPPPPIARNSDPYDSRFGYVPTRPQGPSSLGNMGNEDASMVSTMARIMANAVTEQLSQHLGPPAPQNGRMPQRYNDSRGTYDSFTAQENDRFGSIELYRK